jgi:hypothetical protein
MPCQSRFLVFNLPFEYCHGYAHLGPKLAQRNHCSPTNQHQQSERSHPTPNSHLRANYYSANTILPALTVRSLISRPLRCVPAAEITGQAKNVPISAWHRAVQNKTQRITTDGSMRILSHAPPGHHDRCISRIQNSAFSAGAIWGALISRPVKLQMSQARPE